MLARNEQRKKQIAKDAPDVVSGNDGRILGGVPASDVIASTLVRHQLLVGLDDDRVEVLHEAILLYRRHFQK